MPQAGNHAIVTGGSSGIGSAIVERLVQAGTRVAILDVISPPPAWMPRSSMRHDRRSRRRRRHAAAAERLGGLDRAFLNAGIGASGAIVDLSAPNGTGSMSSICVASSSPSAKPQRSCWPAGTGGSMVVTSSVCGFLADRRMAPTTRPRPGRSRWPAWPRPSSVPPVSGSTWSRPGVTDTPMAKVTTPLWSAISDAMAHRTPLGGFGDPRHVADAAVTLSDLEWVTGQVLAADGGLSLFSPIDVEDFLPDGDAGANRMRRFRARRCLTR